MPEPTLEEIKYPIGPLTIDPDVTDTKRRAWIEQIGALPALLRSTVEDLTEDQLNQRYREGGWTVRQVTHHLADEHLNAFSYFKMAVTEDDPAIRKYSEPLWAETRDARDAPIVFSLSLLSALHARWVLLLNFLDESQFGRGYIHPSRGRVSLDHGIQLYAWHGRHHVAQIAGLKGRKGW